jgi:hypothetical protein
VSGVSKTGEVTEFGYGGHRDSKLHPTEGLQRVDDRGEPPGLHVLSECLFQTRQPCGVVGDGSDVFLEHELLRWGATDHFAEPPEVGGVPVSLAGITDIVSQEKGFEPKRGGLQIPDDIFTRPAQVSNRFILNLGNVDRGQLPRASEACQFDSISAVGCAPLPRLFGDQRRCYDPAALAFFGQLAVKPVPTGAGLIDKDKRFTFRLHLPDEWIDVTLSRSDMAQRDDLRVVFLGDGRHGHRLFMDIQTYVKRASLVHG